ncbi:MAG: hypothetical protein NC048_02230 [Bacteroides sp.]|nr:hypothetical protein [Ruminococcus flavefaciens]MCM1554294.1 hypothetical protein [Bacteroides sp.]
MNTPKLVLELPLLFVGFFTVACSNRETPPDYIESRYYTRVAEAQLAYLQDDYAEAYRILLDLEAEIPLLNNLESYEMPMLVELCLRYGDYEKAYAYMKSLVADHGFPIDNFKDYENLDILKRQPFYDSSTLARSESDFVTDSVWVEEMGELLRKDIACRSSLAYPFSDSVIAAFRYVDSCNFYRLKELMIQHGFPLAQNKRFTLQQRTTVFVALSTLCVHLVDSAYMAFLTPILYQNIKSGDCPPEFLGAMFDSKARADSCFLFGTYVDVRKDMICDVEHLDERRAEIGLPPHRLSCQLALAFFQKSNSNDTTALSMFNCDF